MCKSKRGLSRHKTTKHKNQDTPSVGEDGSRTSLPKKAAESILHPLQLKKMIEVSVSKLAKDECYPTDILQELSNYSFNYDDTLFAYSCIKPTIAEFNGNAEKFYPLFYKCVAKELPVRNLSRHSCLLVGFELANHVLAHLNNSKYSENLQPKKFDPASFSKKDIACNSYLSGYVFSTFYRRIRHSKRWNTHRSQMCLSLLLAGKSTIIDDESNTPHALIDARNRGGLWKMSSEVLRIFSIVEAHFRSHSGSMYNKIDAKDMVDMLLQHSDLLSHFSKVRSRAEQKAEKDIAMDLLEDMVTLFIRVRAFSYAKDCQERHKIKSKERYLRTSTKKKSSCLDQGH